MKSNLQKQIAELFPELRPGTGTIEISAKTVAQSLLESSEWKNGAFTFVIKEAILKEKAKNKNGNIIARSLCQYALDEVEKPAQHMDGRVCAEANRRSTDPYGRP